MRVRLWNERNLCENFTNVLVTAAAEAQLAHICCSQLMCVYVSHIQRIFHLFSFPSSSSFSSFFHIWHTHTHIVNCHPLKPPTFFLTVDSYKIKNNISSELDWLRLSLCVYVKSLNPLATSPPPRTCVLSAFSDASFLHTKIELSTYGSARSVREKKM